MSDNPMFLAVRRNLQPGYIAFKQVGCRLFYTLDNVTWTLAFDYGRCLSAEQQQIVIQQLDELQQLVDLYGTDIPLIDPLNETNPGNAAKPLLTCAIARAIVETFEVLILETQRQQAEASNDIWTLVFSVAAAVASVAAAFATAGVSLIFSASSLGLFAAGAGAAAVGTEVQDALIATSPLPDDQKEHLICEIKEALDTNFSQASLLGVIADVPTAYMDAFHEVMSDPRTWAAIVVMYQNPTTVSGRGCCGDECIYIDLRTPVLLGAHTDRLDGYLTTHNRNPPNLNTSATVKKLLYAKFKLPVGFKPKSIAFDAYVTSTYFASGTPKTKAYFDGVTDGAIYAYETTTLAGHQTYTHTFSLLSNPTAEYLLIEIEVANHNGYYLTGWNAAKAILRAVKVCGEFV